MRSDAMMRVRMNVRRQERQDGRTDERTDRSTDKQACLARLNTDDRRREKRRTN